MDKHFEDFNESADRPDFIEPESVSEYIASQREGADVRIDSEGIRKVLEDLGFPTNNVE